jgi:hypothetical protein
MKVGGIDTGTRGQVLYFRDREVLVIVAEEPEVQSCLEAIRSLEARMP